MPAPLIMSAALAIAGEFLPDLATRLRGPRGRAIADTVVSAAAAAAGVSAASDPQQMIARIKANPTIAKEVQLELEQIDKEAIYMEEIADRDRARLHQRDTGRSGSRRGDWMIAAIMAGLVACIGGAIYGTQINDGQANLDAGVLALITTVAGAMLKMLSDAFAFEFGSSRGSQEKTEEIFQITRDNRQATVQATRDAQDQVAAVAAKVAQATTNAITTGAATATAVSDNLLKPRDFVGQLVRGEV
jgi:hypothetical protein